MSPQPALALALLRVLLGLIFAVHGYHSIFLQGLSHLATQYRSWGVPLPLLFAPLVAVLQLAGGVLLVLGLGVRPMALLLAVFTGAGLYFSALRSGLGPVSLPNQALEFPLLLLGAALALALGGGGNWLATDLLSEPVQAPPEPLQPKQEKTRKTPARARK